MGTGKFNAWGNTVMDKDPIQGGVDIPPSLFILQQLKWAPAWWAIGSHADFMDLYQVLYSEALDIHI